MPWTAADAKSHTKKADTPAKQKQWATVANKVLKDTDDEQKAIKIANAAMDRSMEIGALRGWHPGIIETRLAAVGPNSYDGKSHTVSAILSMGSPVKRFYGTEVLEISPRAVGLDRLKSGGIPLLDSHKQDSITSSLGCVSDVTIRRGALHGVLSFHATPEGQKAEGMVARGEIRGVSAGYRVEEWEITDGEGRVIDPEVDRVRFDDDLTFTAKRWELLEASLVAVPADSVATIRSAGESALELPSIFRRMTVVDVYQRMGIRQAMHDKMLASRAR